LTDEWGLGYLEIQKAKPIQEYWTRRFIPQEDYKIQVQRVHGEDIEYWKSYHISEETLKFFCVKSVHKILNENSEVVGQSPQEPLHLCGL
jgi:hypothetical protein